MGTKNMAAAMGTAVLLYLVLSGRLSVEDAEERRLLKEASMRRKIQRKEKREKKKMENKEKCDDKVKWPEKPPANFRQALGLAAKTVKYTWKETLGRWTLGEIAFGIKYHMKQQGNLQHEYTEGSSILLRHDMTKELVYLMRHLKLCLYFSKKTYKVFMEHGGYNGDDVLIKKDKARLMMPNFTIVRDTDTKCFLLLIRGAISVKERLTAATGVAVPFHHVVIYEGVITDVILGHAHCGMVTAARWIAKQSVPVLAAAIQQHPDYNIKIIGHSMGAGVASILTYMLREHKEFSSCTCIAYAPAACMTWELAESGKDFITTLVNRTDLVPCFSKVSAAQLHADVTVSSWVSDLRDQIQHTRFLNLVNRSVAFLRSHVPFVSHPHSKVVDADMLAKSNEDQTKDSKEEETDATEQERDHPLSCIPCMGRRNHVPAAANPASPNPASTPQVAPNNNETTITESELISSNSALIADLIAGCSGSAIPDSESDSESELEITRESKESGSSKMPMELLADANQDLSAEGPQMFPPGRIMHMVVLPAPERDPASEAGPSVNEEELVDIYETPRELYGKIRLARSMIRDHYMPKYIKTLQMLIDKFAKQEQEENL